MSNFTVSGQVDELRGSPMSVGSLEEIIDEKYVSLLCSWCRRVDELLASLFLLTCMLYGMLCKPITQECWPGCAAMPLCRH